MNEQKKIIEEFNAKVESCYRLTALLAACDEQKKRIDLSYALAGSICSMKDYFDGILGE